MQHSTSQLLVSLTQRLDTLNRRSLRKIVDDRDAVRSKSGSVGILKEEVWVDEQNAIVKYSLAYIHHGVCSADQGRVLGYDNAHGRHERHRMVMAEAVPFTTYKACLQSFLVEVHEWRERT